MKTFKIIIILMISLLVISTGCMKKTTVQDYPNLLLNVDLTPGEEENEVAVFLYVTKEDVKYTLETKKDKKYSFLTLDNSFKASRLDKLDVDGLEELLENARVTQIDQEKNKKNPVITKIIFKNKSPEVVYKPVLTVKKVSVEQVQKAADNSSAADIIAQSIGKGSEGGYEVYFIAGFWALILGVLIVYWLYGKISSHDLEHNGHNNHVNNEE